MMRTFRTFCVAALVASLATLPVNAHDETDYAALVDPMIGTMGAGFVFPGPAAPYGMVQLSPDTDGYFAYTGYQWIDRAIRGFSHVHVQSMGVPEGGNVPFMPVTGAISTHVSDYQSGFSHANEETEPGYYRVHLDDYGIDAELTAGVRVGMHRYTFPSLSTPSVLIDAGRQIPGGDLEPPASRAHGVYGATLTVQPETRTVVGTANPNLDGPHRYAVHFAARFDKPFDSYGVWSSRGAPAQAGVASVSGSGSGGYVSFPPGSREVNVKVGISFVSQAGALANLADELPGDDFGFDALRSKTRAAWNDALGAVDITGGLPADRTAFYTALYHAQHHPNVFNDANGDYLGHDGAVHRIGSDGFMPAGSTYYANFSLWDTYRAQMPLLGLIAPDRFRDMMRSFAAATAHGASIGLKIPRWALMNRNPDFMIGEPALQTVADGYCRGLVPADVADGLYTAMRNAALNPAAHRDPDFVTTGWTNDASRTFEHASGAFALATVADARGETADRDALLALADNWRNVFDPETRFARHRSTNGTWKTPYRPELPDGWKEGTGWQYSWLVSHDVGGLYEAMGAAPYPGEPFVLSRLDEFFSLAHALGDAGAEIQQKITAYGIAYAGNQYAPSNEHDLQAPWLYNWTSQPWKTQHLQRTYQSLYRATPDGLPGNDDLGTMSSWFVWSALGFYPMIPGAPVYIVGSPLFERAEIRVDGGSFVVDAPGASRASRYISSATLNGLPLQTSWFTHDDLAKPGTLSLPMIAAPNPLLWTEPASRPPSQTGSAMPDFACTP